MPRIDWLVTGLMVTGGAETFVRRASPRLRQAGWDLRVITLISGGHLVEELRQAGVPVIELDLRGKSDLGIIARLVHQWRGDPPDLVHTHLYHAGLLGRLVAYVLRIGPVVVHQHGAEQGRSWLRTRLDRYGAAWVSRYVATCQAVAQMLQEREGIPASQIQVIYNGLDTHLFDQPTPSKSLPPGWPVPPGALCLGYAGRLAPEKGLIWLLEALKLVNDLPSSSYNVELHTVLIGDGPQKAALQAHCTRLGIAGQVHFVGLQTNVAAWLPHFDLFALPSEWEGVSLALLEAMAAGLPVVASAVGGTPEVVIDGITGVLVPPCDSIRLAGAIERLSSDASLRQRLGAAGQERIRQRFTLDETTRQLGQLYQTLLQEKKNMR